MWTLTFLSRLKGLAPLVLRLVIGVSFFAFHGLQKLRPEGAWDWGQGFAASGHAAPVLLYIAAWTEFLGGFALALGVLTRWAALGLLGVMLYAILVIHAGDPYSKMELAIAYAGGCVAILGLGPGSVSLDRLFFGKGAVAQ